MSKADEIFAQNMTDIIENGFWDTHLDVRPKWEDGTPAHTVKKFGVVNRYNLQEEFPILTLRRTAFKSCVDELLWIWQKKSNNIHDLNSHIWDSWADETGSIGKAYGYQLGFGKTGAWFYEIVRGNDLREVEPNRERISLGVEDTFPHDLTGADACAEELKIIAKELERRLSRANFSGYTLTLKIKFSDFTQMTRSRTRDYVFSDTEDLWRTAKMLLEEHLPSKKPVRLLGITISNAAPLVPAPVAKKASSRSRTDDRQLTLPI